MIRRMERMYVYYSYLCVSLLYLSFYFYVEMAVDLAV
jgi:hypothetical protein